MTHTHTQTQPFIVKDWNVQVCLLLVIGVVVTTCHLGGDTRDKRRPETRQQRAEMIMIKGYWRSKPALESH